MNQLKTQLQNTASNFGRRSRQLTTGVVAGASLIAGSAYAAIPSEATGSLTEAGTDIGTLGWAVMGLLIAAAAFKYMRRAL
ncbi:hypothetical protein AX279_21565 [Pseudomonas sp. J237]|nr:MULTISPECIES: major capsid protein [Pseudomonas]OEO23705.1 hypothetical protein AX279_21565 [Pseudomonas sp. J237]